MSNIDVLSRPGNLSEIKDRLLMDIKHAKQRLYVAITFISEDEIMISNSNPDKVEEMK